MIRVTKPAAAPARLNLGVAQVQAFCQAFQADPAPYESGALKFEIDRGIFGHADVKNVLRAAQHKKCCFCEGKFEANAPADVEHFRPKAYSQQQRGGPRLYPGYYWLAYSWDNLFYGCQACNRSNKRNYFPLRNPGQRARNHNQNLALEQPLILNPSGPADPRNHIKFREHVAVGVSDEGRATVDYTNLNRLDLIEDRLEEYNDLKLLLDVIQLLAPSADPLDQTLVTRAQARIAAATTPEARFSAMAADLINGTGVQ